MIAEPERFDRRLDAALRALRSHGIFAALDGPGSTEATITWAQDYARRVAPMAVDSWVVAQAASAGPENVGRHLREPLVLYTGSQGAARAALAALDDHGIVFVQREDEQLTLLPEPSPLPRVQELLEITHAPDGTAPNGDLVAIVRWDDGTEGVALTWWNFELVLNASVFEGRTALELRDLKRQHLERKRSR